MSRAPATSSIIATSSLRTRSVPTRANPSHRAKSKVAPKSKTPAMMSVRPCKSFGLRLQSAEKIREKNFELEQFQSWIASSARSFVTVKCHPIDSGEKMPSMALGWITIATLSLPLLHFKFSHFYFQFCLI